MTFEDFKGLYLRAYKGGAKGCTTFNVNGKRAGILSSKEDGAADDNEIVVDAGAACFYDPDTGERSCDG